MRGANGTSGDAESERGSDRPAGAQTDDGRERKVYGSSRDWQVVNRMVENSFRLPDAQGSSDVAKMVAMICSPRGD